MKTKIPFLALLATGVLATTSCSGGGFKKVLSATYKYNNSTIESISSSTLKTRTVIGAYKFASTSYSSQIKGYSDIWNLAFSYYYNMITNEEEEEVGLPHEIVINLQTYGTTPEKAKMTLQNDCGVYESWTEAFINEASLEGKSIHHTFDTYKKTADSYSIVKGTELYYPNKSTDSSSIEYYYLTFARYSTSDLFTINISPTPFVQMVAESHIRVGNNAENITINYQYWPY